MTASATRTAAEGASAPVPFSYAQAAKGMSTNATSASAKQASGTSTPAKDAVTNSAAISTASVPSWADDAEELDSRDEKRDTRAQKVQVPSKQTTQDAAAASAVTSPSSGAPSSTTAKDDDAASVQNASSESASNWENKSQASTSVDKTSESGKSSEKARAKSSDKTITKPLQEAPVPAVNPWARRADELRAKAAQKVTAPKVNTNVSSAGVNAARSPISPTKKAKGDGQDAKEKAGAGESKPKGRDEERTGPGRKELKPELDSDKSKKGYRSRPADKEPKIAATVLPLPPDRDQESWPTPETAVDEERKRAQNKGEKSDPERKEPSSSRPHGKQEWVTVPYTPTVVFNTPLPSTMSSRRGGRGGGRGGSQANGRNGNMAGSGSFEKDASAPQTNGDTGKRGRPETSAGRDVSGKEERAASVGSSGLNDLKTAAQGGEKPGKAMAGTEADGSRKVSVPTETGAAPQSASQNNGFTRPYGQRSNKGRRGDFSHQAEKRKEGEGVGQGRDASHDRRTSAATHTELADDGERRSSHPHDVQNGQARVASNERRQYGSFSRDRPRGGGRGSRGGPFQNPASHQFTNGHASNMQGSSTFAMRSPTTFHPDQNAYFPAGPHPNRSYRGGHRSQSVTGDNIYGRASGYSAGAQQIPPIQTFMPGMYDYQMMSPMSAVPYSPYAYDHGALMGLVTGQLEYYFSVDNLCKDMFLRKHMDSQGFVFLSVIAEFNRVKQLTTDIELLKYVCYNAPSIDFRVGVDGRERIRRREGWEQWVLSMSERDPSAQNDGSDFQSPPVLHPNGFDPAHYPGYPTSPTGVNGNPASNNPETPIQQTDSTQNVILNGQAPNGINGFVGPNGHHEMSTKAVSGEPDSFPDAQVETLSVIVRMQGQPQVPDSPLSASGTRSNGSLDSNNDLLDDLEEAHDRQSTLRVNSISVEQGYESRLQDGPLRILSPFAPFSSTAAPMRLFWVRGRDAPVDSLPFDSTYESYTHLRFKALEQRESAAHGVCPYDMDVLYQFWSHFLVRNFNLRMYQEFRHVALEDSVQRGSHIGLTNLIKYYGESLLSTQAPIRPTVARDYMELVKSEEDTHRPAFAQLWSAYRNVSLSP